MLQSFAKTFASPCLGNPRPLRSPHFHPPSGRHQQQNQNHETSSLWVPRPRIPPTQNPWHPSNQVRFSRMNPFSHGTLAGQITQTPGWRSALDPSTFPCAPKFGLDPCGAILCQPCYSLCGTFGRSPQRAFQRCGIPGGFLEVIRSF